MPSLFREFEEKRFECPKMYEVLKNKNQVYLSDNLPEWARSDDARNRRKFHAYPRESAQHTHPRNDNAKICMRMFNWMARDVLRRKPDCPTLERKLLYELKLDEKANLDDCGKTTKCP